MIDRNTLEIYATWESRKREAQEAQDKLKPEILAMVAEAGQPIEVSGIGTFSTGSRPKWEYSEFVKSSETSLKERKKEEEANGEATRVEGEPYPIFKPLGND